MHSGNSEIIQQVFKIVGRQAWQQAHTAGVFTGSPDDLRDGFVHLSTREQLSGTAARHFAGADDLLLVAFDAASLGPRLKWEASRGGALFPHLYAALPTALAIWCVPLRAGADGVPDVAAALALAETAA